MATTAVQVIPSNPTPETNPMRRTLLALLLSAIALPAQAQSLRETLWKWADHPKVTVNFGDKGYVFGEGPCNRYQATYEETCDNTVKLGPAIATRMACPEPAMTNETKFFAILEAATGYRLDEKGLTLLSADGTDLATLVRR